LTDGGCVSAQQQQIRVQLSNSLVAVFSQTLVPKKNPKPGEYGRVMAQEIMLLPRSLIREGKTAQIYSAIQTGGNWLCRLWRRFSGYVQSGKHLFEMAMSKTSKPDELQRLIGGVTGAAVQNRCYAR